MVFDLKIRMFGHPNAQVQVACSATAHASLSSAGYAEALAFSNASRDLHLVSFCSGNLSRASTGIAHLTSTHAGPATTRTRHGAPDLNGTNRAAHRFVKGDHNVAFNIAATFVTKILLH
jgi:hypothetical protein